MASPCHGDSDSCRRGDCSFWHLRGDNYREASGINMLLFLLQYLLLLAKLLAWERGILQDMYEPRPMCTSLPIAHMRYCVLLFITAVPNTLYTKQSACVFISVCPVGPTKSTVATFPRTRECRAREVLLRWQRGPRGPRATGEPACCALYTCSVRVSCLDPVRVLRALAPPARCRRPRCAQARPRAATLRHPAEPWCQLGRSPSYGE